MTVKEPTILDIAPAGFSAGFGLGRGRPGPCKPYRGTIHENPRTHLLSDELGV
jgi:hypothetical protein